MKILFSSYHNYLDSYSGAAITTREILRYLSRRGDEVHVLCGPLFDSHTSNEDVLIERMRSVSDGYVMRTGSLSFHGRSTSFKTYSFSDGGVSSTIFLPSGAYAQTPRHFLPRSHGDAYLALLMNEIRRFHPTVYATYGGYWAAARAAKFARSSGVKTIFFLHNLSYDRKELFDLFDSIIVPSQFAADYYRTRLGIATTVVPPLINERQVIASSRSPDRTKYITLINASIEKGALFAIELARELSRVRPEIPILFVAGRSSFHSLSRNQTLRSLPNISFSPGATDPRAIYDVTRLLLAPSLCEETFGRVAIEAAWNGIPALCAARGALPEVMGQIPEASQLILPLSSFWRHSELNAEKRSEVLIWRDAILNLWDDEPRRRALAVSLQRYASRYSYETVSKQYAQALEELRTYREHDERAQFP